MFYLVSGIWYNPPFPCAAKRGHELSACYGAQTFCPVDWVSTDCGKYTSRTPLLRDVGKS